MDQRLKYEQLIGEKLEALPVPDMQDMIWARVKAQLDIDLPTDDEGGEGGGPQSPSGPGIVGWGLSVIVIALVTTFFIYKNKTANNDRIDQQVTSQPINQPSNQSTGPPVQNEIKKTPQPGSQPAPLVLSRPDDSASKQDLGVVMPGTQDSSGTRNNDAVVTLVPPPIVPKADSIPGKKKGKGVSGLKDDDYKIVPKKN